MKFIDLFAGVGGFRLPLEKQGHECVFTCEIDKYCQAVYKYRFGDEKISEICEIGCYNGKCISTTTNPNSLCGTEYDCSSDNLVGEVRLNLGETILIGGEFYKNKWTFEDAMDIEENWGMIVLGENLTFQPVLRYEKTNEMHLIALSHEGENYFIQLRGRFEKEYYLNCLFDARNDSGNYLVFHPSENCYISQ